MKSTTMAALLLAQFNAARDMAIHFQPKIANKVENQGPALQAALSLPGMNARFLAKADDTQRKSCNCPGRRVPYR